jgi:hypothetical protein
MHLVGSRGSIRWPILHIHINVGRSALISRSGVEAPETCLGYFLSWKLLSLEFLGLEMVSFG